MRTAKGMWGFEHGFELSTEATGAQCNAYIYGSHANTTGNPARAYLALATPTPSASPIATAATLNATFAT